jgi:hypothetical protein
MTRRPHPRPRNSNRLSILAVVVLSLLAQLLTPALQVWHLASDGDYPATPVASLSAGPDLAPIGGPQAPAHHHDDDACPLCQTLTASRLAVQVPALTVLIFAAPTSLAAPLSQGETAPTTADLATRPPRGPPAA